MPLYEQLHDVALEKLDHFDEHETSSAVVWRYNSVFAEVSVMKDCMVVAFASDVLRDEWEPSKVLQTSRNRVVHYFEVMNDVLFPEDVREILEQVRKTIRKAAPDAKEKISWQMPTF